jgi:hypothetical protein
MGITPKALREHLMQVVRDMPDAPKRQRERKPQHWISDGSSGYDPSEEDPKYTGSQERYWRSIGKKVAKNSRIR